jgi:hypothetical protein
MTSEVSRFMQFIHAWLEVEWHRFTGGYRDDGKAVPPLVVWRYADPTQPKSDLIQNAIDRTVLQMDWYYNKIGRNWVLTPRRILEEQRTRSLPTDVAALNALVEEDQDFCQNAMADFSRILRNLEELICT